MNLDSLMLFVCNTELMNNDANCGIIKERLCRSLCPTITEKKQKKRKMAEMAAFCLLLQ